VLLRYATQNSPRQYGQRQCKKKSAPHSPHSGKTNEEKNSNREAQNNTRNVFKKTLRVDGPRNGPFDTGVVCSTSDVQTVYRYDKLINKSLKNAQV